MSDLAIHFLNDEDEPVTQEAVDKMVRKIRKNQVSSAWQPLHLILGTKKGTLICISVFQIEKKLVYNSYRCQ